MPSVLVGSNHGAASAMHEGRQAPARANTLDERIAALVSSNALPPAPSAAPTLYDHLNAHLHEVQNIRRQITRELCHVHHQIANFQRVPRGRHLSLIVQQHEYSRHEAELERRIGILADHVDRNLDLDLDDMIDSSEDEELVLGSNPAPSLDYGSDSDGPEEVRFHVGEGEDAPTITLLMREVEGFWRNARQRRRARRAGQTIRRRRQELEDPVHTFAESPSRYEEAELAELADLAESVVVTAQRLLANGIAIVGQISNLLDPIRAEEYVVDSEDLELDEDDENEDEGEDGISEPDNEPTPTDTEDPLSSDSENESTGSDRVTEGTPDERPRNWQQFHHYFMYSCRGDVSAVTSELQEKFHFEPEMSKAWVGKQLNEAGNIREQIAFLETYLPGEAGTMDRAQARDSMSKLRHRRPP